MNETTQLISTKPIYHGMTKLEIKSTKLEAG
jgi:hypothetical protein